MPANPISRNIETIARLEQEFLEKRTVVERIGDGIGSFVGTMTFVIIHLVVLVSWVLWNTGEVPGLRPFDPFPFMFLSMSVSIEGVLLTTFVLMKQNRMSKRADQRNQLNLQIDLLSEKELTNILGLLRAVCQHMGLEEAATSAEVEQLSQATAVENLAHEIQEKLPE